MTDAVMRGMAEFEAPEVVVVFLLEQLSSNQVVEYSMTEGIKTVQDAMLHSASSLVLPSVYLPVAGSAVSVADMIHNVNGEVYVAGGNSGALDGWANQFSAAPVLDLAKLGEAEIFDNGLTDTIVVPMDLATDESVMTDVLQAIGARSHVAVVTALHPSQSVALPHSSAVGRKLLANPMSSEESLYVYQNFNNIEPRDFHRYISINADGVSGIFLGLILVCVVILATSCTMGIQTPSQMWPANKPLPLKGRVDFG